jgi:hypothetical protein
MLILSGQLNADDLCWCDGAPDWVALQSVHGIIAVPPSPPAPNHRADSVFNIGWISRFKKAFTPAVIAIISSSLILPLVGAGISASVGTKSNPAAGSLIKGLGDLVSGSGFVISIVGLVIGIIRLFKSETRFQGVVLIGFYLFFASILSAFGS